MSARFGHGDSDTNRINPYTIRDYTTRIDRSKNRRLRCPRRYDVGKLYRNLSTISVVILAYRHSSIDRPQLQLHPPSSKNTTVYNCTAVFLDRKFTMVSHHGEAWYTLPLLNVVNLLFTMVNLPPQNATVGLLFISRQHALHAERDVAIGFRFVCPLLVSYRVETIVYLLSHFCHHYYF